jgi:hypothetical protein
MALVLCPVSLRGMILFYEGAKLCRIHYNLIISFVKLNILGEPPDGWPETGVQRRGWRLSLLVSRVYGIYGKDCLRISWTTQSQVSLWHTRSSANRNLATLGVWMNSIFTTCENVEFWNRKVESVLGHSDYSFELAPRLSLFSGSPGRVSNLPVCSVHWFFVNM